MNLEQVLLQGLRADQPDPSLVGEGSLYFVTDEEVTEQQSGGSWTPYSSSGGSGGITQLTGDVTAGPGSGSVAATIANDAVTNAKMANMAQSTIKGRAVSAGTGDPTDLSATQATAILNNLVGDSGSGGTKGLVPAPSAGDAAAGKFLKADATWAVPSGGGITPSVSIAQASQPATVNVTTDGTTDWLVPNGTTSVPRTTTTTPNKALGGWLFNSFDWIGPGTPFTQNDTPQVSCNATDNMTGAALSSSIASQGTSTGGSDVGLGWRFTLPPSPTTATVIIYCSCFSAEVRITAALPMDGLSDTEVFDSGAAAGLARKITITYKSAGPLNVRGEIITNHGSSPNIKFQAATVSN